MPTPPPQSILDEHNLSPAQWYVLASISTMPLRRSELIHCSKAMSEGFDREVLAQDEIERAIDRCVRQALIVELNDEDCERDRLRWEDEEAECCSDAAYRPGALGYTEHGYRTFHDVSGAFQESDTWIRNLKHPNRITIFARSRESLEERLAGILRTKTLWDEPLRIRAVDGPHAVGPFWVDRFTQVKRGYKADIEVESRW